MCVILHGPADFPALYRSADRESERAQRSYLRSIRVRVMAWIEAKQHRNLATAYGIASQELASIASELPTLNSEDGWADFVAKAEEAISREHTLWRALPGRPDRFRRKEG